METVKHSTIDFSCGDLAKIVRIIDGDTIEGECIFRGKVKIRLNSIDSFESRRIRRAHKQARDYGCTVEEIVQRGKRAKGITEELVLNKSVAIFFRDRKFGMYGRLLGDIYFINNGEWINLNDYLLVKYTHLFFKYGK